MRLEDIGFYTLSEQRAKTASSESPLQRCEMILTSRCNFKCPYCRSLKPELCGDIDPLLAKSILTNWIINGLKNIRFSGGEPTLYLELIGLVNMCKDYGVERIAISSNGFSSMSLYQKLINAGVNDISISLDACCASTGDIMAGKCGVWNRVVEHIKELSKLTYVTTGIVFTEQNIDRCVDTVLFADSLGVSDIRVIPSAQYNEALTKLIELPEEILNKYPILRYRINNVRNGVHVRGLNKNDCKKCYIVLDDMAVAKDYHFPCIIYMREGGDPIGKMNKNFRQERLEWHNKHNVLEDKICSSNCLECLSFYNRQADNYGKIL